jgi:hypothetical protein
MPIRTAERAWPFDTLSEFRDMMALFGCAPASLEAKGMH